MQQINNGFEEYYYLTKAGEVYNSSTKNFLKDNRFIYTLKTIAGEYKKVSLKTLYRLVYNKNYCIDNIKDLEGEIWKPIERTNEEYWVSNYSRIKSLKGNKAIILQPNIVKNYSQVIIYYGKSRCGKQVSRLVAAAFLLPPATLDSQIHHINGISTDNRAENLMWVTPEEHREIHRKGKKHG